MTWTTLLDWAQNGHTGVPIAYGKVTLQETDANDVKVTVELKSPTLFSDNGNGHVMFGFSLLDNPESTVTLLSAPWPAADVAYSTSAVGDNTPPNGSDFANQPFGHFDNSWQFTAAAPQTLAAPFVFNVHNSGGVTFAGVGATYDSTTGKLLTLGTGNHFFSNGDGTVGGVTGGWWFSADTSGSGGCTDGLTCAIAGRDAIATLAVPEPATWALMIAGFGGAGAMLRRRRAVVA